MLSLEMVNVGDKIRTFDKPHDITWVTNGEVYVVTDKHSESIRVNHNGLDKWIYSSELHRFEIFEGKVILPPIKVNTIVRVQPEGVNIRKILVACDSSKMNNVKLSEPTSVIRETDTGIEITPSESMVKPISDFQLIVVPIEIWRLVDLLIMEKLIERSQKIQIIRTVRSVFSNVGLLEVKCVVDSHLENWPYLSN